MDGPTPRPELPRPDGPAPLEAWAGIECSRVRVKRRIVDQVALTGHRDRLADIERIAGLGVRACRYPVLWEHVAPRGLATADWTWADDRLGRLRAAGVRPIVGLLHHGGGPRGMSLRHPAFPAAFARYAAAVARRFPWLVDYLPINEPLTTARFAGLYGVWHPHAAAPEPFARLLIGQCLAIRAAMRAVRTVQPAARLIVNEDVGRTSGTVACADLAVEYQTRRWATWDLLFGRVDRHHPMWRQLAVTPALARGLGSLVDDPCPPDLLGVDHYVTSDRFLDHRVAAYEPEVRPPPGDPPIVDVEAVRVAGAGPGGLAIALADTWARYRRPLALTEVALAGAPHDQVAWWQEAWATAEAARRQGARIEAVTAWAVVGAVGWDQLLRGPRPTYQPGCFDVSTDPPRELPVARAVRASAAGRSVERPLVGWWRRPDRYRWTAPSGEAAA